MALSSLYPGSNSCRLTPDGLATQAECDLAQNWMDTLNRCERPLDTILGFEATPRDKAVAATIIQWLGTHVGTCFLAKSFARSKSDADHLIRVINQFKAQEAIG